MQNIGFTHTNKEWAHINHLFWKNKNKKLWKIEKTVKINFFFFFHKKFSKLVY